MFDRVILEPELLIGRLKVFQGLLLGMQQRSSIQVGIFIAVGFELSD